MDDCFYNAMFGLFFFACFSIPIMYAILKEAYIIKTNEELKKFLLYELRKGNYHISVWSRKLAKRIKAIDNTTGWQDGIHIHYRKGNSGPYCIIHITKKFKLKQ